MKQGKSEICLCNCFILQSLVAFTFVITYSKCYFSINKEEANKYPAAIIMTLENFIMSNHHHVKSSSWQIIRKPKVYKPKVKLICEAKFRDNPVIKIKKYFKKKFEI